METTTVEERDESEQVTTWRYLSLVDLGFHPDEANRLSPQVDVVHKARKLIAAGCSPRVAAKILL